MQIEFNFMFLSWFFTPRALRFERTEEEYMKSV